MNWWMKTSLVLLLTLATTIFMYEGWYKPKQSEAALTALVAATVTYNATGAPANVAFSVGSTTANRMLVVGVNVRTTAAVTQTCSATYGGVSMTAVPGTSTGGTSSFLHTYWFYLTDNAVMNSAASSLVVSVSGGTVNASTLFRAGYSGVDQSTVPGGGMFTSGTTSVSSAPLGTGLTINTGDVAFDTISLSRTGSLTPRTLSVWATNWAIVGAVSTQNTVTPGVGFYHGTSTTASASDTVSQTASGTSMISHSAVQIPMLPTFKVGETTNPASANVYQGNTGIALDGFSMKMGTGTGTVSTLTFTGSAGTFITSNIAAIKIYRDNGTVGTLDGADVMVATTTGWAANVATITFTSAESVSTTAANYLLVVDVAAAAAANAIISGTITAATGTGLGTDLRYFDASSASCMIKSAGLYISESLGTANASMPQSSLANAMNGFKLFMGNGSSTVNTLTLTGSAQFTSANVAAIRVYRDKRGIGHVDAMDDLVPTTTAWASNVATITFTTPESVTSTVTPYLIAIDAAAAATVGNTLSGTITAATGTGLGTVTAGDKRSATLTVAAGAALTVGDSTDPASVSAPSVSLNNAIDGFTLALGTAARAQVNTVTLTGSANLTTSNVSGIRVFADNGTAGTLDRADTLIPTTYTHTGTAPVITFTTPEVVTNTAKKYLVIVDINTQNQATVGNTLTAYVSAVTGSGYAGTPTYSDNATLTTLTIAKSNAVNNSCAGCHGYGTASSVFPDGTASNTPPGTVSGSHGTHNGQYAYACSKCHTTPTTETSADYGHSSGTIVMATNINGESGASYGKGASWNVVNPPTAGQGCSGTYCHSQGTGKTTYGTDTRTVSTPSATLNWGASAADNCDSCHGYPPSYANGATTWGAAAKANSHAVHTTECESCHSRTAMNSTIVNTLNHANGVYNVMSTGSTGISPRRSFVYTYAVGGGTCATISCHGGRTDVWGTTLDCTTCHAASLTTYVAKTINALVISRRPITPEFAATWSHKRSASGVVTKWDCIVCHMEGDPETGQADFDYHGNGYIELRDPDTGATIKGSTFSTAVGTGPGKFVEGATDATFVQFSKNYGATNPEADANFATQAAIQNNLCLKCHDANGAMSVLARVPGGSALKPFATTITNQSAPYPSYYTANAGSVVNVFTSFSSGSAAYHPVRARANNSYIKNAMLNTGYKLATDKTGTNTTSWGLLVTCWDCHAVSGITNGTVTSTVTAHGNAVTLRAPIRAAGATATTNLCVVCHVVGYAGTANSNHLSAGTSAFGSGGGSMTGSMASCHYCHAYTASNTATVDAGTRPLRGEDVHGVNERTAGTANSYWATSGIRPVAFIRNSLTAWRPASVAITPTLAAGTATCGGTGGTCNNNMTYGTETYTPGGSY